MKRNSFLRSLLGLIVAPTVINDIDWGNKERHLPIVCTNGVYYEFGKAYEVGDYKKITPLTQDECVEAFSGKPLMAKEFEFRNGNTLIYKPM